MEDLIMSEDDKRKYDIEEATELLWQAAKGAADARRAKSYGKKDVLKAIAEVVPALVSDNPPTNADVIAAYEALVNVINTASKNAVADVKGAYTDAMIHLENESRRILRSISDADNKARRLEEDLERLEKLKHMPSGVTATSLSPDRWFCSVCGCKMGKVALDGVTWGWYTPKFCPNCGSPTGATGPGDYDGLNII